MDPIYVTGHRNPDTDSIVAAISYAALRNACGDREYEAACLGRVSGSAFCLPSASPTCTIRCGIWILTSLPS